MDAMIRSQGYSTRRFQSLESAYYNKPTPLQRASYDVYMIDAVKALDHEVLSAALEVGISPNPCNAYAESLVHMVSRRGDSKALQILVDNGCNLQVADDYGRTPFHDCCWAADPAFEVAEIILAADPRLFYMTDSRGAVPLSYVRKEHWPLWIEYLESKKHMLWPTRNIKIVGEEEAPTLTLSGANSRPLQDPENAVPVELAAMIASGKMTPGEAQFLKDDKTESTCDFSDSEDEDDDSDYDSDEEDDFGMDVGQMADILNGMPDPYEVGETSWTSW
jgi:ankyrin repeat protein